MLNTASRDVDKVAEKSGDGPKVQVPYGEVPCGSVSGGLLRVIIKQQNSHFLAQRKCLVETYHLLMSVEDQILLTYSLLKYIDSL